MKIGTEEIIYWLRKNEIHKSIPNEILGRKTRQIIEDLGGVLIDKDISSRWDDTKNVDRFDLPKTSAQYEIDFASVSDLYNQIREMKF